MSIQHTITQIMTAITVVFLIVSTAAMVFMAVDITRTSIERKKRLEALAPRFGITRSSVRCCSCMKRLSITYDFYKFILYGPFYRSKILCHECFETENKAYPSEINDLDVALVETNTFMAVVWTKQKGDRDGRIGNG